MNEFTKTLIEELRADKESAHAYINEYLNAMIATQIKVLREQNDYTQQKLADLAGMQQARISVLENVNNDMWSISTLQRLAEAFDVTLKVSFESFSSRIQDIQNFNRASLERLPREIDLAQASQPEMVVAEGSFSGWYSHGSSYFKLGELTTQNAVVIVTNAGSGTVIAKTADKTVTPAETAKTNIAPANEELALAA